MLITFSYFSRVGLLIICGILSVYTLCMTEEGFKKYKECLTPSEKLTKIHKQLIYSVVKLIVLFTPFIITKIDDFQKIELTIAYYVITVMTVNTARNVREATKELVDYSI